MPRLFIPVLFACFILIACGDEKNSTTDTTQKIADSLLDEVMEGHDIGMAKMMKISAAQKKVESVLDSIQKLPARAQASLAGYKAKLDSLSGRLKYADYAMNRWMEEFKYDSAKNDLAARIKYLTDEKLKVNNVKEAILSSLATVDTLIR